MPRKTTNLIAKVQRFFVQRVIRSRKSLANNTDDIPPVPVRFFLNKTRKQTGLKSQCGQMRENKSQTLNIYLLMKKEHVNLQKAHWGIKKYGWIAVHSLWRFCEFLWMVIAGSLLEIWKFIRIKYKAHTNGITFLLKGHNSAIHERLIQFDRFFILVILELFTCN